RASRNHEAVVFSGVGPEPQALGLSLRKPFGLAPQSEVPPGASPNHAAAAPNPIYHPQDKDEKRGGQDIFESLQLR
ncbi:MAG: hypothetical protein NTV04_11925, partial [Deltaproteobacteria bacterium]|nr:hypothetical protein [Deltaproteobacteria bacterium]